MSERVDPFSALKEMPAFPPTPKRDKPVANDAIDRIAEENGFPSRPSVRPPREQKRKPRVHRTGRNRSLNIKVTQETADLLYKLADERKLVLGALLDEALKAIDQNRPDSV